MGVKGWWGILMCVAVVAAAVGAYAAGFNAGIHEAYGRAREEVYMEAWGSSYTRGFREGNKTGFEEGFKAGFEDGFKKGYVKGVEDAAGRAYSLRDPASSELEEFLRSDETETLRWSPEGYSPIELAAELKERAAKAGFRCGFAIVFHEAGVAFLNCFNTTDKGLIFVEPWSDRAFTLKPGDFYVQWRTLKITVVW